MAPPLPKAPPFVSVALEGNGPIREAIDGLGAAGLTYCGGIVTRLSSLDPKFDTV
jgi:hypothetical protein